MRIERTAKTVIAGLMSVACLASVAACGPGSSSNKANTETEAVSTDLGDTKYELKLWDGAGLKTFDDQLIEAFQKKYPNIKINCVPVRDFNLSEIPDIAALAEDYPIHVRFIEMMPIGLGKDFQMISEAEICHLLKDTYGSLEPIDGIFGNGPAHYYHIPGFKGHIGFISAMSHMFCDGCNRIRLTTDGQLKTCLFYENGIDLKSLIRNNCSDEELRQQVCLALQNKPQHHEMSSLPPELRGMSQIGG